MRAGTAETELNPWQQVRTVTVPVFVWYWYEGRREAANWGFRMFVSGFSGQMAGKPNGLCAFAEFASFAGREPLGCLATF